MSPAPVVSVINLSIDLGTRRVLDRVSLRLERPGLVALVGPNGAGKSTLLRVLAGLLRPASGQVQIDTQHVDDILPRDRARRIAYLPQDRTVHWPLRVRDVVGLGRTIPGGGASAADQRAIDAALTTMDATHLADRPILDLSGGERARVLLARALAQEPQVLLADEPAAGLDPAHQWALHATFAAAAARNMRVLVATHDLALAARFAGEIVILAGGRLVAHGSPSDVLTSARLADVFRMDVEVRNDAGTPLLVPRGLATSSS